MPTIEKQVFLNGKLKSAEVTVREHTLAVCCSMTSGEKQILFRDYIKKDGKRYNLFHQKSAITVNGRAVTVRTAAIEPETGEPIPGLLVTYRFDFDEALAAFYLSVSYGMDTLLTNCAVRLMDVSWEGMEFTACTGYEYDANGKPFSFDLELPREDEACDDYENTQTVARHTMWEKMKARPVSFRDGIALRGSRDYLAIIGGYPSFQIDARYISVFPTMNEYDGDLRFYSGQNSPGAWFLLEEPADFFAQKQLLSEKTPELPMQILLPSHHSKIVLESGRLTAEILQSNGGLWITSMDKTPDGKERQPFPLFRLSLWDTQYSRPLEIDAGAGWDRIEVQQKSRYVRIITSDPDNGRIAGISVILEAFLDPKISRISWKMRVINRSDRWSISNATYPQALSSGYDTALLNISCGVLVRSFTQRSYVFRGEYPRGHRSPMAFTALYDPICLENYKNSYNGLYMGVHDANGSNKPMCMAGAPQSDCVLMYVECPATYLHKAGNTLTLPGEMVWQRFSGDWYDAANIYREFVHTCATYFPKLRGREDSPQWLREMPVWVMEFLPNENPDANPVPITLRDLHESSEPDVWYRNAIRLKEELGVPMAYHVYNWHWVPFNNDNPHYFPTHHDFKEGVRALHENGIRVVPYVAGFSWDMHDHRGDDYRFENEALPNTAKQINGDPVYKSYAATEPNGILVKFARMCPSTTFWKNEVRNMVRKLYTDYDVDGVYLDVISAGYAHCCDENHLHTPGFGNFWWQAYAELMQSLHIDAPKDFAITSESVSEVYTAALDAFLTWTWVQPDSVPVHPRVYSGYVSTFGRVITLNKRHDDAYFRFHTAQELLFGEQLGWIHPEIVDDPKQLPFLKKMVSLRWQFRDFFPAAEMIRPPHVEGTMDLLDTESYLRVQHMTHEKSVLAAGWEGEDGKRMLFVVNTGDHEADCTLTVLKQEYDLPENITDFTLTDGFMLDGISEDAGICTIRCRIAAEGYGILVWNE